MNYLVLQCLVFITALCGSSSSRVLELSDKFIDISNEGMWFVKFYAPWCAHCRRIEPIWAHVAQALYNTPIKVAKVDCTRFTAVATHFKVRAFPTIMFIKGTYHHEYAGEREKDEMVTYAMRMSQPAVQKLSHVDSIADLKDTHSVFFGYVGKQQGSLWEMFNLNAEKYQPHSWFYAMTHETIKNDLKPTNETSVFVYKEDEAFFFKEMCKLLCIHKTRTTPAHPQSDGMVERFNKTLENHLAKVVEEHQRDWDQYIPLFLMSYQIANPSLLEDKEDLNKTLDKWINTERFGFFPRISRANINELMNLEKYIVIAIVSENKLNVITQTERDFKDMIESIIRSKKHHLHHRFQFGWMGTPELANSIAMTELTVPNLLVLNTTTGHHHIPEDDPVLMTPEAVSMFLDQVHNQLAPTYGGNSWPVMLYRGFFEARTTLASMWYGNPVLTALVFGLPLGFLSLICYSVCCADILDADEEDEAPETHEKED